MFIGDSLSRHMTMALYILLSGDLRYGRYSGYTIDNNVALHCGCDGQFPESLTYRHYVIEKYTFNNTCTQEICTRFPNLKNIRFELDNRNF
jgi:hypothetical protein